MQVPLGYKKDAQESVGRTVVQWCASPKREAVSNIGKVSGFRQAGRIEGTWDYSKEVKDNNVNNNGLDG